MTEFQSSGFGLKGIVFHFANKSEGQSILQ
jgi:hypothetical protein